MEQLSVIATKPRIRVKAGSTAFPGASAAAPGSVKRATARYLRGDRAGILGMRRAITRDARHDVREAAERASALATDFLHNSGWIAGAVQQILCDTVGEELKLNCKAKLRKFGYSEKLASAWCRNVEAEWRQWAWNPKECDLAGKATIAEMVDAALRSYLVSGEAFAVLDSLPGAERRRLGVSTETKVSLVAPHRCPRVSREPDGLDQGIFHDPSTGRAIAYRFRFRDARGVEGDRDIAAMDVIHVMDRGEDLNSPRGISVIAPALKVIAQSDQLADATLATTLMQTIFAATIKSPEPSEEAFRAIETLSDMEAPAAVDRGEWAAFIGGLQQDLFEVWDARIGALKDKGISMSDSARVNHLGPGEEFELHTAQTPGAQYLPFFQNLLREVARCLGLTFENLTMDHSNASYSAVRMAVASIWPIVLRRRSRIAAPFVQGIFERWLDEMIRTGKIPFRGGYQAFLRDRESVFQAEWGGPAAPSADDYKSAMADKIELELGISSFFDVCAKRGKNGEEQIEQLAREKALFEASGVPHPFGRTQGGGGPMGAAVEGNREPERVAA